MALEAQGGQRGGELVQRLALLEGVVEDDQQAAGRERGGGPGEQLAGPEGREGQPPGEQGEAGDEGVENGHHVGRGRLEGQEIGYFIAHSSIARARSVGVGAVGARVKVTVDDVSVDLDADELGPPPATRTAQEALEREGVDEVFAADVDAARGAGAVWAKKRRHLAVEHVEHVEVLAVLFAPRRPVEGAEVVPMAQVTLAPLGPRAGARAQIVEELALRFDGRSWFPPRPAQAPAEGKG